MSDDTILSHAEALTEIKRLRHLVELRECSIETLVTEQGLRELEARIEEMKATADVTRIETAKIISRQQARITELEAELAITTGKWASQVMDYAERDDQPATITHDVPPNAPR